MAELIPAILVKDADTFRSRLKLVEGSVSTVQIDCMDGAFVPNTSWYEAQPIDTTLQIELHLMVNDPLKVIEAWKRVPQVVRAIWHVEIKTDHAAVIKACSELGWECGLALSPETPTSVLAPLAGSLDEVLILGVHPGFSGQALIPSTIQKARDVKHQFPFLLVGFDGGVSAENADELIAAGVDRLCVASAIFQEPDPHAALHAILSHV